MALRDILSAGLWVSLGLMLGRVAGLVRESFIASSFGATREADIAVLLLTVPDLLTNVLIGGGLSAALIPELARLNREQGSYLYVQSSLLLGVTFALAALLGTVFVVPLIGLFAPGFDLAAIRQTVTPLSIALWLIPLTALAGVARAYLHAEQRFAIAAFGTLIVNLTIIVGLLGFVDDIGDLAAVAGFVVLGGVLRWLSQSCTIPTLRHLRGAFSATHVNRQLLIRYAQAASATGLLLIVPVLARAMASYAGEGSLATLNYALKLIEFPLGICVTVLSVVLFPRLAQSFARDANGDAAQPIIREGIYWTLILSLSAMLPMIWFSESFVSLAFGHGRMDPTALHAVAGLMGIGLLSLPLQGMTTLLTAIFNARLDTRTPFVVSLAGVIVLVCALWLIGDRLGVNGIVMAIVVCYFFIAALQITLLARLRCVRLGAILWNHNLVSIVFPIVGITGLFGMLGRQIDASAATGVGLALLSATAAVLFVALANRRYRDIFLSQGRRWLRL